MLFYIKSHQFIHLLSSFVKQWVKEDELNCGMDFCLRDEQVDRSTIALRVLDDPKTIDLFELSKYSWVACVTILLSTLFQPYLYCIRLPFKKTQEFQDEPDHQHR